MDSLTINAQQLTLNNPTSTEPQEFEISCNSETIDGIHFKDKIIIDNLVINGVSQPLEVATDEEVTNVLDSIF